MFCSVELFQLTCCNYLFLITSLGRVALTELKVFFNNLEIKKKLFVQFLCQLVLLNSTFQCTNICPFISGGQIKSRDWVKIISHAVIYLMLVAQSSAKAIQLWVRTQRNILFVERSILMRLNHKFEREYRHIIMLSS